MQDCFIMSLIAAFGGIDGLTLMLLGAETQAEGEELATCDVQCF